MRGGAPAASSPAAPQPEPSRLSGFPPGAPGLLCCSGGRGFPGSSRPAPGPRLRAATRRLPGPTAQRLPGRAEAPRGRVPLHTLSFPVLTASLALLVPLDPAALAAAAAAPERVHMRRLLSVGGSREMNSELESMMSKRGRRRPSRAAGLGGRAALPLRTTMGARGTETETGSRTGTASAPAAAARAPFAHRLPPDPSASLPSARRALRPPAPRGRWSLRQLVPAQAGGGTRTALRPFDIFGA